MEEGRRRGRESREPLRMERQTLKGVGRGGEIYGKREEGK